MMSEDLFEGEERTCRFHEYTPLEGHWCEHGFRHICPMYLVNEEGCVDYEKEVG